MLVAELRDHRHRPEQRALLGHLRYGVPQLGPSLIPEGERKVSACAYPWRESFIEYNGIVAPCCNPADAWSWWRATGPPAPGSPPSRRSPWWRPLAVRPSW